MRAYLCHGDAWMVSRATELVSFRRDQAGLSWRVMEKQAQIYIFFLNKFQQPCMNFYLNQSKVWEMS